MEANTALIAVVDVLSNPAGFSLPSARIISSNIRSFQTHDSASLEILAIVLTQTTGKSPLAVSPESMTQSAPSKMAFATSLASALVGLGFFTMDSSIWVAQMTAFPARLHSAIIAFCAMNTFSVGISIPISPRATISPSLQAMISVRFLMPCWFSILGITQMFFPFSPNTSRICLTPSAFLMKEAKTMSTPCSTPSNRSDLSFSETAGRSVSVPGRLQPFLEPRFPSFSIMPMKWSLPISVHLTEMRPSSMKSLLPISIILNHANEVVTANLGALDRNEAVVDEKPLADLHHLGDVLVVEPEDLRGTLLLERVICCDLD